MKQDPEYLKNQSRHFHARYRRNRIVTNVILSIWTIAFAVLFFSSVVDWMLGTPWGLANQMLGFFAFAAFGGLYWCFQTLIGKLLLAYVRHTYWPDPDG